MLRSFVEGLIRKQVIGASHPDGPLLERYHLLRTPWFRVMFHVFHRSDADVELHDHPWSFLTIILKGGYTEVRPIAAFRSMLKYERDGWQFTHPSVIERAICRPGMVLWRPHWWAHRVELERGQKSYSLVFAGPFVRSWGFFTADGWKRFDEVETERALRDAVGVISRHLV